MDTSTRLKLEYLLYPSEIHALEHIPLSEDQAGNRKRWQVVRDVAPTLPICFDITDLEFVRLFQSTEESTTGHEVLNTATTIKAELGLSDIKRFLAQDPETLRLIATTYTLLIFAGTRLKDLNDEEHFPCLEWDGDEWYVIFVGVTDQINGPSGTFIRLATNTQI